MISMLTLDHMDFFNQKSFADSGQQAERKRKKKYLLFFLWEVIRFGLVWTLSAGALNIDRSYSTALYLLYIMAPGLVVIAGFFLLWQQGGKDNQALHAVMVMSKGFQVIFGTAAAVLLLQSFGTHPLFFRGEFISVGATAVVDLVVSVMLIAGRR